MLEFIAWVVVFAVVGVVTRFVLIALWTLLTQMVRALVLGIGTVGTVSLVMWFVYIMFG